MLGVTDGECDFGGFEVPTEVECAVEGLSLGEVWWAYHPAKLRPVLVDTVLYGVKRGYFHRWIQRKSEIMAVVELEDGSVVTEWCRKVRFADVLLKGDQ